MKVLPMKTAIHLTLAAVLIAGVALPAAAQTGAPSSGAVGTTGSRPAAKPADTSPDYRMVPGDKLRVEVYKDAALSQNVQIRPDGKITLPYVGDMPAAGLTPTALRDSITQSLKEYIASPTVTVMVVETQPQTVSVLGEVNSPGVHPLKHQMTVLDALAAAGGFGDFANTKNILIERNTKNGVDTLRFNYKDAIKPDAKPFYLQPGDIIIVP
jgi:polysaccharide export outer membrane protein